MPTLSFTKRPGAKPAPKPAPKPAAKAEPDTEAKPKRGFPARKDGAAPAKPKRKRKPLPVFKAPADMRPFFAEFDFITAADSRLTSRVALRRVKGGWETVDEDGRPKNRRFDMFEYDAKTAAAVVACFQSICWKTTPNKEDAVSLRRLDANTRYRVVLRAGKNAETNALRARVVAAAKLGEVRGKPKLVWFDDVRDPEYRLLRKATRFLPSAFINTQQPPTGRQKKEEVVD